MPTKDTPLNELATSCAGAVPVFHRHRLDFCCGGARSLVDACAERGLDADALLAEIEGASAGIPVRDWSAMTPPEIAALIVEHYHLPLREDLPRLLGMARKVERVHGDKQDCPRGLADHLAALLEAVEDHLEQEENVLFPSLSRAGATPDAAVVTALVHEHDDHATGLRRTRELAHDLVPPTAACTTWRALYLGLEQFERDLMEHVHLENTVLFPRALNAAVAAREKSA